MSGSAAYDAVENTSLFTEVWTFAVEEAIAGLAAQNDSPTELGQVTTLTATVTAGSNVTYTWAFGDGDTGNGATVNHVYPATGPYTAVVTAANLVNALVETTSVQIYKPSLYIYLPLVQRAHP